MRDIVFKTLVAKRIAGGGGRDGSCKGSTIKLVKDVVLLVILAAYCSGEDPLCGIVRFDGILGNTEESRRMQQ